MKKFTLLQLLFVLSFFTFGQSQFVDNYGSLSIFPIISDYSNNAVAVADYDNDNDLDLIICPSLTTGNVKLFRNMGAGVFQSVITNLPLYSIVKWFDYNNDSYLDLLIYTTNNTVQVYQNSGPPAYVFSPAWSVSGTFHAIGAADLNRNGRPDIYLLRDNLNNRIYENRIFETGNFVLDSLSMNSTTQNSAGLWYNAPCDVNKDGYSDVFIKFFNNNEAGVNFGKNGKPLLNFHTYPLYEQVPPTPLNDFDGDGYYDLVSHAYGQSQMAYFHRLQGDSMILADSINLSQYIKACFDYDNDGMIDIISGNVGYTGTNFYHNNSNFSFSLHQYYSGFGLGDYHSVFDFDNDKDLDLFANSTIYKNQITTSNTTPTPPVTMWTTMDSAKIVFHWSAGADAETPNPSLSYNIMVGSSSKGIQIVSPMSDTATGYRRIPAEGNAFMNKFFILDKSSFQNGDTLFWSVQTIDNSYLASPFSEENKVIVCQSLEPPLFDTICSNDSVLWHNSYYHTTGKYFKSYSISGNCDSSFALDLTVFPVYLNQFNNEICSGNSYNWYGQNISNSGIYDKVFTSINGCDSVERLVLDIHPTFTNYQITNLCIGDSLFFGNSYLKNSGFYIDSLNTIYGCDSLIQLNINTWPADTVVIQKADTLIALSTTAQINWFDCSTQTYVFGAVGQTFIPQKTGYYSAEISENGCTYTTKCFEVIKANLPENLINSLNFRLFPNPSSDVLYISHTLKSEGLHYKILSLQGKTLSSGELKNETTLNIQSLPSGIYHLTIYYNDFQVYSCRLTVVKD